MKKSPAKLKEESKKFKGKGGKTVKIGKGKVSKRRAERLVAKGKGQITYAVGGIGKDNQPGGKNNPAQLMKIKKKSVKIKKIKK